MSGPQKTGSRLFDSFFVVAAAAAAVYLILSLVGPPGTGVRYETVVGKTSVSSDALYNYETTRYQSSAKVIEEMPVDKTITVGIASGTDDLDFGEIPAGSNYARREISLVNLEDAAAMVSLDAEGSASPYVRFSRDRFVLEGRTNATVGVFFSAQGAAMGDYSGEVTVQIKRPKYAMLPVLG